MVENITQSQYATLEWISEYAKSIRGNMILHYNCDNQLWTVAIVIGNKSNNIAYGFNLSNVITMAELKVDRLLVAQKLAQIQKQHGD